jgi:Gas vesicle protein
MTTGQPPATRSTMLVDRVSLVDLLDRVLARGVVVSGELTLTIADVDLVHLSLRALLSSVRPDLFGPDQSVDDG